MADGIYTALSGAVAEMNRIEVNSHNLANVSTPGFKQFRLALEAVGGASQAKELSFAAMAPPQMDLRAGPLRETGNPLDVALDEGVYMAVADGGKTAYSRGGALMLRPDGTLVTNEGMPVMGEGGKIVVAPGASNITVAPDGTVQADDAPAGRLKLVEFGNQQALQQGQGQTFIDPGGAGARPAARAQLVRAGYREEPNMEAIRGMTDLIAAHRSYDAALKAVETFSQVNRRAARDIQARG
ncbi:MAG: flagellar hook basal-body protein [Deltaproteobacteria bacterium]|nr:flagellar hook basal-body protein [Deltaproteobacteria bacterium]